ncbi:MAG TPA: hypothetical protein VMS17_17475 [Gemmataceae bacterium]|nr:hypothetical protein [Gemmataceae bacterium]
MQPILDRIPLCRCFADDRPALPGAVRPIRDVGDPVRMDRESPLSLRPDVNCLQRWIDLNA